MEIVAETKLRFAAHTMETLHKGSESLRESHFGFDFGRCQHAKDQRCLEARPRVPLPGLALPLLLAAAALSLVGHAFVPPPCSRPTAPSAAAGTALAGLAPLVLAPDASVGALFPGPAGAS